MWTTASEINFIKHLGTHSTALMRGVTIKELLTGYLSGCEIRVNWEKIDREAVVDFARKRLLALGA